MRKAKGLRWLLQNGPQHVLAVLISLFIFVPIFVIAYLAFAPRDVIYKFPKPLTPGSLDFSTETIKFFVDASGTLGSLWNSVIVAVLTVVVSTAIGAPAGYALARFFFSGKEAYRLAIVTTRAFPVVILAIPLLTAYLQIGLSDTLLGVALLHTAMALPLTVLVSSTVFAGVPVELEEAAMTMGCSRVESFFRVALPQAIPGLAATSIFAFVLSWNEVFGAAVLTLSNRTLPALLVTQLGSSSAPYQFAGGFFILAPALLFIFVVRKYLFDLWGVKLK